MASYATDPSGTDRSSSSDFEPSDDESLPLPRPPFRDGFEPGSDEGGADSGPHPLSSSDTSSSSSASTREDTERLYRGKVTKTKLIRQLSFRVPTKKRRVSIANDPHRQQARNGWVKEFTPRPDIPCCQRHCSNHFLDPENARLNLAREPLYDATMPRSQMRDKLIRNSVDLLTHPEDGKPVCTRMNCIAFSCSISMLIPNSKRTSGSQGDSNRRRSKGLQSVMAWFNNEKELADVMPDTGVYNLAYPRRHAVYERYLNDCREVTACECEIGKLAHGPCGCPLARELYTRVSESYLRQIWSNHFPNCQIRRHMRFSKCDFCVKWRSIKHDRKLPKVEREHAKCLLSGHYDYIARERTEEITKVWFGFLMSLLFLVRVSCVPVIFLHLLSCFLCYSILSFTPMLPTPLAQQSHP
jgi:hypothetical protein